MEESISTWYFKRTLRDTPSGSQVSYSYTPSKARDSISTSYRPSYGTRIPNHRPKISTYRRRKYPTKNYYQVWYVSLSILIFQKKNLLLIPQFSLFIGIQILLHDAIDIFNQNK